MKRKRKTSPQTLIIKIFDFYIFSNIHVSFATFFLVKITLTNIGISENHTAWFVFFSTLISYNIIRFLRINEIDNWYNTWLKQYKKQLFFICLISFIGILYLVFYLRVKTLLVLFPFALSTAFYVFPIQKYSLRKIAGLKLFIIAFSWAGITVLIPIVQNYISLRPIDWITFIQRFLFIIASTIPFDIRDISHDESKLKTLPQQIGIHKIKSLGIATLFLFIILELIKEKNEQQLFITISISLLSGLLLLFSTKDQSKYYSALFVESLPIIWWLLYFIHPIK